MSKILILLLTIFTAVPFTSTNAQEPNTFFVSSQESLTCEDVLPNNSVPAIVFNASTLDLSNVERNSSVDIPLRVSNNNSFPVQNVNVHLSLFKVADSENLEIPPQLYLTQLVNENLTLEAGEVFESSHPFTIPASVTNGTYRFSTYVDSNQRFSLSGTSALEINPAAFLEFTISEGQPAGAIIDRNSVQVNGIEYIFSDTDGSATASSIVTNGVEMTQISVITKHVSDSNPTSGTFTWEEFIGSQPNHLALAGSQTTNIELIPGTQSVARYQLLNPLPTDYTVVGTFSTENSPDQTIVISFSEGETDSEGETALTGPVITDPIDFATFAKSAANENSTDLLFCYTPANLLQYQNPSLNLSVSDTAGVIGEYSVDLSDTYSLVSQADRFSFPSAPGEYTVEVSWLESDTVVSTSTLQYFNEPPETQVTAEAEAGEYNSTILVVGIILLGLLIFGLLLSRRSFTKLDN